MTDGERWARELLADLRAARFAPPAWARFLARSFERAAERRHERRREHLEALALGAAGILAWAGVAAAGFPALAAAGAGWWLSVVLMLDWHLGMLERPDGSPVRGVGLPNLLSLLRLAVVPALAVLSPLALAVVLGALGVTDVMDGEIARRRDAVTRLGRWLDGSADTFVLGVASVAAWSAGLLPSWAAALVLARWTLLWLLLAAAYFARGEASAGEGHVPGRVPGLVLFAGLLLALAGLDGGAVLVAAGAAGGVATTAATAIRSPALSPR